MTRKEEALFVWRRAPWCRAVYLMGLFLLRVGIIDSQTSLQSLTARFGYYGKWKHSSGPWKLGGGFRLRIREKPRKGILI